MPLKTQLCGASGEVIEQIVFSNIDLPERIPGFDVQAAGGRVQLSAGCAPIAQLARIPRRPLWEAMRLPPDSAWPTVGQAHAGIERAGHAPGVHRRRRLGVGVRRAAQADYQAAEGPAAMGSSSAFSTVVDGHQITAVGEVPPNTVQFIATQVKAMPRRAAPGPGNRAGTAAQVVASMTAAAGLVVVSREGCGLCEDMLHELAELERNQGCRRSTSSTWTPIRS
jgi:hypothetical protein